MNKLILIRHGQTASNAAGLIQGTANVPLSHLGVLQAAACGEALEGEALDSIISSPLSRALQTARAIASHHRLPVTTDIRIQERAFGTFQGGPIAAYRNALEASGLPRWEFRPGGGETIPEVWARCAAFLDDLKTVSAKTVLVTAHEGVNRCIVLLLLGRPVTEWSTFKQQNCCINRFWFGTSGAIERHLINDTSHLGAIV